MKRSLSIQPFLHTATCASMTHFSSNPHCPSTTGKSLHQLGFTRIFSSFFDFVSKITFGGIASSGFDPNMPMTCPPGSLNARVPVLWRAGFVRVFALGPPLLPSDDFVRCVSLKLMIQRRTSYLKVISNFKSSAR